MKERRLESRNVSQTIDVEVVEDEQEARSESECDEIEEEEVTRLDGEVEKYSPEDDLRSARRLIDPRLPTTREVKDHELKCHVPHRNWCWVCVRAEGKDLDHRADPSEDRNVPECFDFAFPGGEFGHKTAVLVGKERMSGLVLAAAIPCEGLGGAVHVGQGDGVHG